MKIIQEKLYPDRYTIVSALGQQSAVEMWEYAEDTKEKGVYWFWPQIHDEPGVMVHVGSIYAGEKVSEGYGDRIMDFLTKDGVVKIQGPWHTNTDALYEHTGVDLRDKHRTRGAISLRRGMESNESVLIDVVYLDPDSGVVGTFDRINELAQKMSDENDTVLFYYRKSSGGSSCGPITPTGWSKERIKAYWDEKRSI